MNLCSQLDIAESQKKTTFKSTVNSYKLTVNVCQYVIVLLIFKNKYGITKSLYSNSYEEI